MLTNHNSFTITHHRPKQIMSTTTDCSICCDVFNEKTRKPITCPKCNIPVCTSCVKTYLKGTLEDYHCMQPDCRNPWDQFFVNNNLPRSFVTGELKKARADLLFRREQSYFPETMVLVAGRREKDRLAEKLKKINAEMKRLTQARDHYQYRFNILDAREKEAIRTGQIAALPAAVAATTTAPSAAGFKAIRQCATASCKGFCDTSTGECPVCTQTTCLRCNTIKTTKEHECNKDDVDTWQLIASQSKPCPNCATPISKTEGCDQMWCPGCHTAFSWQRGMIDRGPIHNPVYYEYAARLGQGELRPLRPIQIPGGGGACLNMWEIRNYFNHGAQGFDGFRIWHRKINHIIYNELRNLHETVRGINSMDLRLRYLTDKIQEKDFRQGLVKKETERIKKQRIIEIYESIEFIATNILRGIVGRNITSTMMEDTIRQIDAMEAFVGEMMGKLNKTFGSKISPPDLNRQTQPRNRTFIVQQW